MDKPIKRWALWSHHLGFYRPLPNQTEELYDSKRAAIAARLSGSHYEYQPVKVELNMLNPEEVCKIGRFGHHPDPATDFAVEVDEIEGMVADVKAGLEKPKAVDDRLFKAMQFRVGGTVLAVAAKQALRQAAADLKEIVKESK
jgi:hypothetical protein